MTQRGSELWRMRYVWHQVGTSSHVILTSPRGKHTVSGLKKRLMAKEKPKLKCVPGGCCSEPLYTVNPSEPIRTWDELLNFYKNCEPSLWGHRWIFRAQEDSTWCLTSSLERAIYRQHEYFSEDGRRSLEDARKWEKRLLPVSAYCSHVSLSTARQDQLDGVACSIAPSRRPNEALGLDLLILDRDFLRDCKG